MNEIELLQKRIDALEVRQETTGIIVTALLALVPDANKLLAGLEIATELHDANLLYATSLSDDQRRRVLEHLRGLSDSLRRQPPA